MNADELAEAYQLAQELHAATVVSETAQHWALLNLQQVDASAPVWVAKVMGSVLAGRVFAAQLAGAFYAAMRALDTGRDAGRAVMDFASVVRRLAARTRLPGKLANIAALGSTSIPLAGRWPAPVLDENRLWRALMWTGPGEVKRSQDAELASSKVAAVVQSSVLQAGRDSVQQGAVADERAVGWIRVPERNACAFCLMLASRGPVYHTEATAVGVRPDHYHRDCRCVPRPWFDSAKPWPPVNQWAQQLWADHGYDERGTPSLPHFRSQLDAKQRAQRDQATSR